MNVLNLFLFIKTLIILIGISQCEFAYLRNKMRIQILYVNIWHIGVQLLTNNCKFHHVTFDVRHASIREVVHGCTCDNHTTGAGGAHTTPTCLKTCPQMSIENYDKLLHICL